MVFCADAERAACHPTLLQPDPLPVERFCRLCSLCYILSSPAIG
jgi:hypothetical protein